MKCAAKHIVGFSGGIDSQAAATWVLNRFPREDVILINSNVGGWESPLTERHIRWFSENVHPVVIVTPLIKDLWETEGFAETKGLDGDETLTFQNLLKIKKRPPGRKNQFCTTFLKLKPQKRWIEENMAGVDFDRWTGVRRDESRNRRHTSWTGYDDEFECPIYHPLFDWTKDMCFDYCASYVQEVNPLYKLGFKRVGCAPCIHSGREEIRLWATRFPDRIEAIRKIESETGITFFMPLVPGKTSNNIDEVVAWAMCTRGGSQFALDVLYTPPACESKYGLCE